MKCSNTSSGQMYTLWFRFFVCSLSDTFSVDWCFILLSSYKCATDMFWQIYVFVCVYVSTLVTISPHKNRFIPNVLPKINAQLSFNIKIFTFERTKRLPFIFFFKLNWSNVYTAYCKYTLFSMMTTGFDCNFFNFQHIVNSPRLNVV